MLENAYTILYSAVIAVLCVASLVALIRSITGKTIINRFIGINILTTLVAVIVCVLSLYLKESYTNGEISDRGYYNAKSLWLCACVKQRAK